MIKQFYLTHRCDCNSHNHSGQSGPGSNNKEGILHIPQNFRTGVSQSDAIWCHIQDTCWGGVLTSLKRCSWHILQHRNLGKIAVWYCRSDRFNKQQ